MSDIKKILVPTDFSEPADSALTYATALASKLGASILLVHVFEDPFIGGVYTGEYVPMPAEMRAEILGELRKRLADTATRHPYGALTTELLTGPTAQTIVETAQERGADLIVIGTHGRGGVAHLLLGSVTERVVRTAVCPVLTVRTPSAAKAKA